MGQSINTLLGIAYNVYPCRMVFATKLPEDRYDFIANLPDGNDAALRQALEKQFNLTAKIEKRKTNVLLLTVKNRNARGLKANSTNSNNFLNVGSRGAGDYFCTNAPLSCVAGFLEYYFEIPVVDKTGLAGRFDIYIQWQEKDLKHHNLDALKKVLLDEFGLELVPGREPVEMLVVSEAH